MIKVTSLKLRSLWCPTFRLLITSFQHLGDADNNFGFPLVKVFSAFTGFITLTSGFWPTSELSWKKFYWKRGFSICVSLRFLPFSSLGVLHASWWQRTINFILNDIFKSSSFKYSQKCAVIYPNSYTMLHHFKQKSDVSPLLTLVDHRFTWLISVLLIFDVSLCIT